MRRLLALALFVPVAAQAAEQCVWPFRDPPADVAARMKAALGERLEKSCPGQHELSVTFLLKPARTPSRVAVSAPDCNAAVKPIAAWVKSRPASEFLTYTQTQDVAFKLKLRFSRG